MDELAHYPILIHHAAKCGHNHPPSSLRAIRACLEADARVIEADISPLADGDFLLFHGQHLEDGTDGSSLVATQTTSEVSHLHYTRSGGENTEPVGILSQVMELLRNLSGKKAERLPSRGLSLYSCCYHTEARATWTLEG